MAEEEGVNQNAHSSAISIRPPAFSPSRAKTWFNVIEAQFANNAITTSITKFRHALSNLPLEVVDQLSEAEQTSNNYDQLKNKVIGLFTKSEPQIFKDFLTIPTTLTSEPSQFLNPLRNSASSWNLSDDFLRQYFLSILPPHIRPNLIDKDGTLEELARLAANMVEHIQYSPQAPQYQQAYQVQSNYSQYNPRFYSAQDNYSRQPRSNYRIMVLIRQHITPLIYLLDLNHLMSRKNPKCVGIISTMDIRQDNAKDGAL